MPQNRRRLFLAAAALTAAVSGAALPVRAADQFPVPLDAGVINVRDFGAIPNDGLDDTAAIRAAITHFFANWGGYRYTVSPMIYFPNGTYDLSDTIASRESYDNNFWSYGWKAGLHLVGQSRSGVILKLKDNCPGFTGTFPNVKAVIATGTENGQPDGGGNAQAFRHYIRNLTIDTGRGNRGAIAIDYMISNRGAIRDVTIRSGDGQGWEGIGMERAWPGPGLIKNVQIDGFDYSISLLQGQYGMTFEHVTLNNPRFTGIWVDGNLAAIRKMTINNAPEPIHSEAWGGQVVVLDSVFNGGASSATAINSAGNLLVRNLRSSGYGTLINSSMGNQADVPGGSGTTVVSEWVNDSPKSLWTPNSGKTLNLAVEETPEYTNTDFSQWANVVSYGATPWNNGDDDRAAIQAALNSGKPVVYLPNGDYSVGGTLTIPTSVRKIVGFTASISAKGAYSPVRYIGTGTCVIEHVSIARLEHGSTGTLAVSHADLPNYSTTSTGKTFLEDVISTPIDLSSGHRFWGRQINSEFSNTRPLIVSNGAIVWILNLKTEGAQTAIKATGGDVELLGGFLYPVVISPVPADTPAFDLINARASLAYVVNQQHYANHVREQRGSVTRTSGNYSTYWPGPYFTRGPVLYVSGGTTPASSTYSFADISGDYIALSGVRGNIDFGTGLWRADGNTGWAGLSKYAYFATSGSSRSFILPVGASLKSLKLSSDMSGTYTISDGVNTNKTGSYSANVPVTVNTGWTSGGRTITVTFSTGWISGIDDITYNQ